MQEMEQVRQEGEDGQEKLSYQASHHYKQPQLNLWGILRVNIELQHISPLERFRYSSPTPGSHGQGAAARSQSPGSAVDQGESQAKSGPCWPRGCSGLRGSWLVPTVPATKAGISIS